MNEYQYKGAAAVDSFIFQCKHTVSDVKLRVPRSRKAYLDKFT